MKITFIFSCSGMFRNVPECSGMFRNVPACSGMFHVPGFIDALDSHDYRLWAGWEKGKRKG